MSKRRDVLVENILTALANKWSGRRDKVEKKAKKHADKARGKSGVYKSISSRYATQRMKHIDKATDAVFKRQPAQAEIDKSADAYKKSEAWADRSWSQAKIARKWGNYDQKGSTTSLSHPTIKRWSAETREKRIRTLGKHGFGRKWYQ